MTASAQFVVDEVSPSYWRVTFENGPVNLLDADSIEQLARLVSRIEESATVTVVVFDSVNPDYFMAHWDLKADRARVAAMAPGPTGLHPYLDNLVRLSKVPAVTISAIRGRVRGAGSEFVLATDIRFAGDRAILGHPEVGLGSVPGGGPMARLARLVGRGRAAEILLGADDIPAGLAERYGYVNRVLPDAGLAGFVEVFARRIAGFDKAAIARTKALLDWASLPPDEEFGPGLAAFFRTSGRPENVARIRYLFENGLQTPVGVELDLGRAVGEFASSLDPWRPLCCRAWMPVEDWGMSTSKFWGGLRGRQDECNTLSRLVTAVHSGHSQVLVLRGEAGIGKTALLEFLVDRVQGCRVGRAVSVESELELAYAGLHQLCSPYLDRMDRLPVPQQAALGTAFGLQPGSAPDRFLLGLAVLTLLSEVAEEQPLICVVDDAQWLDQASAQTLEFVARRLAAEPVGLVFAVRETDEQPKLAGLPELRVRRLGIGDATALLESVVPSTLDPRVRSRILAESDGNPLALLELPRALTPTELAFGTGPRASSIGSMASRVEEGFIRQLQALARPSRQLLLVAAAEPVGDVPLLWRAMQRLGIGDDAAAAAESAGWIGLGDRVRFRHPLIRSAVYRSATLSDRREAHRALADVTDPDLDPDRRAWHRACAAVGPDEDIAAELERSAGRAVSLGGLAAAAAFLETAAVLTPDPVRRAQRLLAAGQAKATAGAFEAALSLLADAEAGPLDEAGRALIDLLRAQISYNSSHGNQALPLLLAAARRFEALDPNLARGIYLDALSAALFAGRLASGPGSGMGQVAQAARAAPRPPAPGKADLLLEGMSVLYTDGYAASAPLLHRAIEAFGREDLTLDEAFRSAWVAAVAAVDLWDDVHWDVLSQRHLDTVRQAGALSLLPLALASRAIFDIHSGNLAAATALVAESQWVAEVTGGENTLTPIPASWLAAMRGHEKQAEQLIAGTLNDAIARGQGVGLNMMYSARAVLCNGLGRYEDALAAAREAATEPLELGPTKWALAELVEAGVRSGNADIAARAFEQLSAMTRASGTELALGIEAARSALLRDDDTAENLYREALDRLGRTRIRVELARAQLLYGEWLRRQGRRADARAQLRTAYEALDAMGAEAFADRARHELAATGEMVRKRTAETHGELTAQESHIARLAVDGLSNPEIAAELYLSPRTVEWHLRNVFAKLGVSTRRELRRTSFADEQRAASG